MSQTRPLEPDPRERILAAAAQVFAQTGFDGARIDEIADRAGINKAMLYYHVGDKEHLYAAVLTGTFDRGLCSIREAVDPSLTPPQKLEAILHTFARFGSENPVFVPIVMREIASGGAHLPDEMILRMASVFRFVGETLRSGMLAGEFRKTDPLLTHVSLVGAIMFLVASQPVRERVARIAGTPVVQHTPADLADHVANLILHGLETTPGKKTKRSSARRKTR